MTITIVGYFGFANAGDEAILAGMLRNLRAEAESVRIRVISGDAQATEREHRVEAISWQDLTAIGRAIQTSDLLLIGGGGLFHDYWGADPDTLLTGKHWGVAFYASCAMIAHLHRKPVMLYAVGVGPLLSGYGKRLTRAVCEIAVKVSVRDENSKLLLVSIGVPAAKIEVTADPAFSIEPQSRSTTLLPKRHPVVGVAIRRWSFGVYPEFLERELAFALDYFVDETGGSVVFIPFQALSGAIEDDVATAKRVVSWMRKADCATVAEAGVWESTYAAIRSCDVVLGMRLHSVIFSSLAGVPCVVVSYDPKVDAITKQLSRSTTVIDITSVEAVSLKCALVAAYGSGSATCFRPDAFRELNTRDAKTAISVAGIEPLHYSLSNEQVELLGRGVASLHREADAARAALQAETDKDLIGRNQRLRAELESMKQSRFQLLTAMDAYQKTLEQDLAAFRSQKAWQVMLAIRKAYKLFRRSKLQFARFALGAAAYRFGSLREYDLPFPELRQFTGDISELSDNSVIPRSRVPLQTTQYDVIVLGIIDFDFRFQRPQQIAVEMARRGHRIFWVSPSRFVSPSSTSPYELNELPSGVWEVRLRCPGLDVYNGELTAALLPDLLDSLSALYTDTGSADSIVYVQLPFWRRLALRMRESFGSKILYDCMDDWDTFQNMGRFNVTEEEKLASECDLLVVTGAEIERKFLARNLNPVLVRNGVDYALFSKAQPTRLLEGIDKPIVGYFGAIADWIDLDLVQRVAALRPQYAFVLLGQVFDRDTTALESLPNVHLQGSKPYTDIPSYLYLFDACTIPFLLNPVTRATDPVKLYEYLSLGKPVVATAMAELNQCGDLIYIARNAEDFAAKLDLALSETGTDLLNARTEFARANTWTERVTKIDQSVTSLFPLVSILIVTHDSEEFVEPCLDSILGRTSYPNYEIILVDNASTDDTPSRLQNYSALSSRVNLACLATNTGFAAGNNQAARTAGGDFLLFLNVDTIVTPGWIHRLLRHQQRDPAIGLICPVTNFAGNEVKVSFTYSDQEQMEEFAATLAVANAGKELDIETAPLFCALVPRAVWDRVGELDDSFGIGMFEDDDFSLRVRRAGFRVTTAEDCFIHHFGQGSFAKLSGERYNEVFRTNQRRFEDKWGVQWRPHRTRQGVRPVLEDKRFQPSRFVRAKRN